jgi:hypothetical protein
LLAQLVQPFGEVHVFRSKLAFPDAMRP